MTEKKEKILILSNNEKIILLKEGNEENEKQQAYTKINESLKQAVLSENLVILTGAGSSIIGKKAGKTMRELWNEVKNQIGDKDFKKIIRLAKYEEENLEELLSELQIVVKYNKNSGEVSDEANSAIDKIEEIIKEECSFKFTEELPHTTFLKKIIKVQKKVTPRVKIFTLNYDTCFESAADKIGAVIIDGFSFSQGGVFRTSNFDLDIVHREQTRIHSEENFYHNVFHLYKMHGSVNWEEKEGIIYKKESAEKPLLIYPNSSKYESSYQMPFIEMISRFQVALRTQNTTLFIIGYGFNDNHINSILKEAMSINTNLQVFIVSPTACSKENESKFHKELIDFASNHNGLTIISDDFTNFTKNLPNINFSDIEEESKFN